MKKSAKAVIEKVIGCVSVLRKVSSRVLHVPVWFKTKVLASPTYQSEEMLKGRLQLFLEFVRWAIATGDSGEFFRFYGFDIKGKRADWREYIDERRFWDFLIQMNYIGQSNYTVILRDKYLFDLYMRERRIPLPKVIAVADRSGFYSLVDGEMKTMSKNEWLANVVNLSQEFFVKDATSCCGRGVAHVRVKNGFWESNGSAFSLGDWDLTRGRIIVQVPIRNCKVLNDIYPYSLNTMRIVTVVNHVTGSPELLFPGFIRIGCDKSKSIDNISAGGIGVGITIDGRLQRIGFRRPETGSVKCERHPLTGRAFEGVVLPGYKDACELVKRAHSYLPEVASIGWDVAFTPDGPYIIEGNDNWEISDPQLFAGGLRKRFEGLLGVDHR